RGEALRRSLFDRARELAAIEFLFRSVALLHLDTRRLAALEGRETLLAPIADPPTTDGRVILCLAGVDDAGVRIAASGAAHKHKIWDGRPLNLVLVVENVRFAPTHLRGCGSSPHERNGRQPRDKLQCLRTP